jgi:CHAT domain-containing protein
MRGRIFLCAVLATASALSVYARQAVPHGQRDVALAPGEAIERLLSRGEEHRYHVALAADESVNLVVEQRGIDVIVETRGPDGAAIAAFQNEITSRGEEGVLLVSVASGTYTIAVRSATTPTERGSYAIRLTSRRRATAPDRALQEAFTLRTRAAGLEEAAKVAEARVLLERALAIGEAVRGSDDPLVGALLFDLAGNALESRDDARAESLNQRAIAVLEKTGGRDNPYVAMARSRLALLLEHAGQGPKAEALLRESMETIERTLGPEHPWYAVCLTTQANLRLDAGDLERAEAIDRRGLAILEKIGDTHAARYAGLLNNLGEIYRRQEDYARAETFLQRATDLTLELEGPESFHASLDYQNLGIVAREHKEYDKAIDYNVRALSIRQRTLGPEHPDIAPILNNLANIQHAIGHDAAALDLYFKALRIWEKTRGPYHPGLLNAVGNLARTYASAGDIANAIAYQRRADAIIEAQLSLNLAAGSERQKLAFAASVADRTDRTISLHLLQAPGSGEAGALAALVLLQRKGRVLDAMTDAFASMRQRASEAKDRELFDQLNVTVADLSRLSLSAPGGSANAIKDLESRRDQLEAEISQHSAEFRSRVQAVTVEAVQGALPEDAALLEFTVYRPFDSRAVRNAEAYGTAHYAAYVLRKRAAPVGVDLGPAAQIDEAIDALRQALRDPKRADVEERARTVHAQVLTPLSAALRGVARLLVSPDGDLNLVPFEALVDEHGHYLIESYAISYLTSGRDLLRLQVPRTTRSDPIIVADPLFGEPGETGHPSPAPAGGLAALQARRHGTVSQRSGTGGGDLATMYFAPLASTAEEARAIKALFPESTLLTGTRATKAALRRVEAPRMLHIASHGFFLQDPAEAPLLRSGLALAGANLARSASGGGQPGDEGILTALEASGLNLWGTRLVTLSACDTGVGEVRNGEGVYGLRRAFVLAGTETLVMTLWSVSDYITRETMASYYAGLRAGLGRGDALRLAKLAMLQRKGRRHPFYWASFIQSGEWANLDGRR